MRKPQGKCAFCGRYGLTREHLWAEWIQDHLTHMGQARNSSSSGSIYPDGKVFEVKRGMLDRPGSMFSQRLRVVCDSCNSGWMSILQTTAKPILIPFLRGRRKMLDREQQRRLASWIAMFAMVVEHAAPNLMVTTFKQRDEFRRTRIPPEKWCIWITWYSGHRLRGMHYNFAWKLMDNSNPSPPGLAVNTQSVAGVLGNLFFMTFSTQSQPERDIRAISADFARRFDLIPIWPIQRDLVRCGGGGIGDFEAAWIGSALTNMPRDLIFLPWEHLPRGTHRFEIS